MGCSTDDVLTNERNLTDHQIRVFESVMQITDFYERKSLYAELSSKDKHSFWIAKLSFFLDQETLSPSQRGVINSVINQLSSKLFERNSVENLSFIDGPLRVIERRVDEHFTPVQRYFILESLENPKNIDQEILDSILAGNSDPNENVVPECECNVTCMRLTGVAVYGVSWEYGTCDKKKTCWDASWGCGSFGMDGCSGMCVYGIPSN